jgi:hypothetical protein
LTLRFAEKQKTLVLGVHPVTSLADATSGRKKMRGLLAEGVDPSDAKRVGKAAKKSASENTFKVIAME